MSSVIPVVSAIVLGWALVFVATGSAGAASTCVELDERAKALIQELGALHTSSAPRGDLIRRQAMLFEDLEQLGLSAVPAMTRYMDNREALPWPSISLKNRAVDRFEAVRHYNVVKVVDGVAAVLAQLNPGYRYGELLGPVITDADREEAVQGWRRFVDEEFRRLHPGMCP